MGNKKMKSLNIIAIILILTFVNTTKSDLFLDLTQSLVQLHAVPADQLARLNSVQESFQDSHKSLEAVTNINTATCQRLQESNTAVLAAFEKRGKEVVAAKAKIAEAAKGLAASINEDNKAIAAEKVKIEDAGKEIVNQAKILSTRENDLIEVIRILRRLKNIAVDELTGDHKLTTEMGKIKVVNEHGVSFIQRSNLKEELKGLLSRGETTSKALISTLIMMATNDDGKYSDPALVKKIVGTLDRIIAANAAKKAGLQKAYEKNIATQKEIIENCGKLIQSLTVTIVRNRFLIETGNRENGMYDREAEMIQRYTTRRTGRAEFQKDYCNRQIKMFAGYNARYAAIATKIGEMRDQMS